MSVFEKYRLFWNGVRQLNLMQSVFTLASARIFTIAVNFWSAFLGLVNQHKYSQTWTHHLRIAISCLQRSLFWSPENVVVHKFDCTLNMDAQRVIIDVLSDTNYLSYLWQEIQRQSVWPRWLSSAAWSRRPTRGGWTGPSGHRDARRYAQTRPTEPESRAGPSGKRTGDSPTWSRRWPSFRSWTWMRWSRRARGRRRHRRGRRRRLVRGKVASGPAMAAPDIWGTGKHSCRQCRTEKEKKFIEYLVDLLSLTLNSTISIHCIILYAFVVTEHSNNGSFKDPLPPPPRASRFIWKTLFTCCPSCYFEEYGLKKHQLWLENSNVLMTSQVDRFNETYL